jgi:hypothetical protein
MAQFFFHVRWNGILVEDQVGSGYQSASEACSFALGAMPGLMAEVLQARSTHVTTNICNDVGSIGVVRATIVIERYDPPHRKIG